MEEFIFSKAPNLHLPTLPALKKKQNLQLVFPQDFSSISGTAMFLSLARKNVINFRSSRPEVFLKFRKIHRKTPVPESLF